MNFPIAEQVLIGDVSDQVFTFSRPVWPHSW